MRTFIVGFAILMASPALAAFDINSNFAVLVDSPAAPGTGGRSVDCGLTVDPALLYGDGGRGQYPAVFDCLAAPTFVQLREGAGGRWTILFKHPVSGRPCFGLRQDVPGRPKKKALVWNCRTRERTKFTAEEIRGKFSVSSDGCGMDVGDEASYTGFSQRYPAFLNCAKPRGVPLAFESRAEFVIRAAESHPFSSDGCPSVGAGPGSGGAPFLAVLRPACAYQDACYANPWQSKSECDDGFLAEMVAACEAEFAVGDARRGACTHAAGRYQLVALGDVASYDRLQRRVKLALRRGLLLLRYN